MLLFVWYLLPGDLFHLFTYFEHFPVWPCYISKLFSPPIRPLLFSLFPELSTTPTQIAMYFLKLPFPTFSILFIKPTIHLTTMIIALSSFPMRTLFFCNLFIYHSLRPSLAKIQKGYKKGNEVHKESERHTKEKILKVTHQPWKEKKGRETNMASTHHWPSLNKCRWVSVTVSGAYFVRPSVNQFCSHSIIYWGRDSTNYVNRINHRLAKRQGFSFS